MFKKELRRAFIPRGSRDANMQRDCTEREREREKWSRGKAKRDEVKRTPVYVSNRAFNANAD